MAKQRTRPIVRNTPQANATKRSSPAPEVEDDVEDDGTAPGTDERPRQGASTVTVHIPKAFNLIDDDGIMHRYKAGTDEMPLEHAEHWYAKAHGVEIHSR